MSIETLTGDEFMHLDPETHRVALEQYELAIEVLTQNLGAGLLAGADRSAALDKLTSLLTLRKLHKVRLAEMQDEDEQPAPRLASEQYHQNELTPTA